MPALFAGFRLIRRSSRKKTMSYVDEVIERVVAKNPAEPEYIMTKWGVGYYFKG